MILAMDVIPEGSKFCSRIFLGEPPQETDPIDFTRLIINLHQLTCPLDETGKQKTPVIWNFSKWLRKHRLFRNKVCGVNRSYTTKSDCGFLGVSALIGPKFQPVFKFQWLSTKEEAMTFWGDEKVRGEHLGDRLLFIVGLNRPFHLYQLAICRGGAWENLYDYEIVQEAAKAFKAQLATA